MTAFYFDEDCGSQARLSAARRLGLDVLTAGEARMLTRADPEQLAFAASVGRAIVTHNLADFWVLHATWLEQGVEHAGMVLLRQKDPAGPGEVARRMQLLADTDLVNDLRYLPRLPTK